MEYKILNRQTGKEVSYEELAVEMYKENKRIMWMDIEGIARIGDIYYLLDECGNWEYIDTDKYSLVEGK